MVVWYIWSGFLVCFTCLLSLSDINTVGINSPHSEIPSCQSMSKRLWHDSVSYNLKRKKGNSPKNFSPFSFLNATTKKSLSKFTLMPVSRLSLPSVKGWAIWFLWFLPPWRFYDSNQTLSTNKDKYNWLESPTVVPLGNVSMVTKIYIRNPNSSLWGCKRTTQYPQSTSRRHNNLSGDLQNIN